MTRQHVTPSEADLIDLVEAATAASERAYAPYSGYRVGAAVLTSDSGIHTGCNIENASYGLTMCAERVALFNAIANARAPIEALAVYTNSATPSSPCGACRQVIHELANGIPIILANPGQSLMTNDSELLPHPFDASDLGSAGRGAM